jgi:signal transduction histidine kinase
VPLRLDTLDVQPLLTAAVREADVAARPVRHVVDVQPPGLRVRGDRDRLRQLLANLLDNAGRHSPPDGTVGLRARASMGPAPAVILEVTDEGPGIAAQDRGRVFERFTHGGSPQDGSTGLGLAIARWVTDLHDGSIEVAETEDAAGCLIRVTLPADGPVRSRS